MIILWVERLKNGKYRYAERYIDPYTEKQKKISVVLESNSPQAKNKASRLLNELIEEKLSVKHHDSLTFGKLVDEWKESHSKTVKPRTMKVYRHPLELIQSFIAEDVLVKNIDARLLQQFIDELRSKYADNTVNLIKQPLALIFRYALRMEYIDTNPMDRVVTPKRKKMTNNELEKKHLESKEVEAIISKLRETNDSIHIANFSEVIYLTGMRPGELLALRWQDIDFDNKLFHIKHTLDYTSNGHAKAELSTTKTNESTRHIEVPDRVIEILEDEYRYQKINRFNTDFVFVSKNGNHLSINTINRTLKKVSQKLFNQKITAHKLRHAHITLLAEMGIPIKVIMDRVGHSDVNTTLKIYTHTTDKMGQQLVSKLNEKLKIK